MARRVGFGDADVSGRDADAVSRSGDAGGRHPPANVVRWAIIGFLTIWLCAWTAGIVFAFLALVDPMTQDPAVRVFLIPWLIFAAYGWVVVVRAVFRLLRGLPLTAADPG
jgi:hypothetical protein